MAIAWHACADTTWEFGDEEREEMGTANTAIHSLAIRRDKPRYGSWLQRIQHILSIRK